MVHPSPFIQLYLDVESGENVPQEMYVVNPIDVTPYVYQQSIVM